MAVEKKLYASVVAAFLGPARYSRHVDVSHHCDHRYNDPAQLPHCCFKNDVLDRLLTNHVRILRSEK